MTTRPWMPLYVADYLADTAHLDATASGVYLHLIMHYWQNGGLPDDDAQLARIGKISSYNWKKLRATIQKFFHDGWKHKRVDEELANAEEISQKRRDAANRRHGKTDANAPANAEQMQTQSHPQPQSQREDKKEESSLRSVRPASDWPDDGFAQFWKSYPHKVGKPAALKAFRSAERRHQGKFADVMVGLQRYVSDKPPDRPWCNPSTWLNQERWADQPAPVAVRGHGPPGQPIARTVREQQLVDTRNALNKLGEFAFGGEAESGSSSSPAALPFFPATEPHR